MTDMNEPRPTGEREGIRPHYQKLSVVLIGLVALFYALSVVQAIMVPLLFALLLAMLLNPLVNALTRVIPHALSVTAAVLLAMLVLAGLSYFIVTQAAHFTETLPELSDKLDELGKKGSRWAQEAFDLERREVNDAVDKVKDESMAKGGSLVGKTITTVGTL
ncbi:MAG TPA: AI-2E family transporter, partial [Flavobacteriales bacterium]|nr:AI-2E family transporter [Flavobacteriales bacterium]